MIELDVREIIVDKTIKLLLAMENSMFDLNADFNKIFEIPKKYRFTYIPFTDKELEDVFRDEIKELIDFCIRIIKEGVD